MNIKRRHFEMACFTSVVVLLGACSSTPDVKSGDSITSTSIASESFATVPRTSSTLQKLQPVPKPVVVARAAPAARVQAKTAPRVVSTRPVVKPKANYVPPKPIVVAVHNKVAQPKRSNRQINQVRKPQRQPVAIASSGLRRPALPRASAAVVAGAPVIRPATVPRSNTNAQQQAQARAQWEKQQQVLAYRAKWDREQRIKAQQAQQARQAQVQLANARQQQARVQQASYQPRVNNAVLQRPQVNYSQNRLTGDFAGNPRAEAFIRMMASKHRFDPAYVAGVLSRAKATSWLRKQAYKDANPVKRTKKSTGPSWSNYRRRFITSRHINAGTAFYNRHKRSLHRAEAQYGVPAEYILGIMGVETIFGGNVGTDRAIDALATMGFMNSRRGNYFTSELESFFVMTRSARLDPLVPKASWAGALGLPQFMPSNIKKYGVDFDGDGAVNLWTPDDAIGSIANYLRGHGWKPGEIAAIPAVKIGGTGYSRLKNGFKYKHSLSKLARNGLKPAYPGVSGMVNMVKLRVRGGNEYWVGGNNFYVITRYNHSSHYAMAVHQLAQEIRKKVNPGNRSMPRVINASADKNLLLEAANRLL